MTTSIISVDATTSKIQVGGVDAIVFDATGIVSGLGKNKLINGNFSVNQRAVSGTVVLTAGAYGHDRWKAGASGCTYTFATSNNVTTITISAGSLQQVIEGLNLRSGAIVMGWTGTAQGKIGAGAYGTTGVTGTAVGGTNLTVEFGTGTLTDAQVETGSKASAYEQRPFGMELSLCQRYLPAFQASASSEFFGTGYIGSGGTSAVISMPFSVTPRVRPTGITISSAAHFQSINTSSLVASGVSYSTATSSVTGVVALTISGGTAGQGCGGQVNNATAKILWEGCEL